MSAVIALALVLAPAVHGDGTGDESAGWALRPIADPGVPAVANEDWPAGEVDRFLLAMLEREGLQPAPPASSATLLRRVSFDLTGLPPTPAALDAFERDPSSYAEVVEGLLASTAFAERWAGHWLDVARFAESSGGGRSLMFPDAWRYRDYVIDAVDRDVPFDRFVLEQLAGDLLPAGTDAERNRNRIATGFLLLGPTNYEQQDKELLRLDVIDEQIDTVGRAFLGQTFGCARCHDHKFDPVTAEDYYALAGIFASTNVLTPGNVSGWTTAELEGPVAERWRAHQAQVEGLEAELARLVQGTPKAQSTKVIDTTGLPGLILDDGAATLIGEWLHSTSVAGYLDAGYLHDKDLAKGENSATWTPNVPAAGRYDVRLAYTPGSNRATNVPVTIEHLGGRETLRVDQRQPPRLAGAFVSLGTFDLAPGMETVVTVATTGTNGHVIVDGLWLLPAGEVPEGEQALLENSVEAEAVRVKLEELKQGAPPAPGQAMVAAERADPIDEPYHFRGAARDLGDPVPRRAPGFCAPASPAIAADVSGRFELAQWILDPSNPLTARVRVNRIWSRLFGTGLVRTADNFGAMGERPSHPELLDWLAQRHLRGGWSTKALVRDLVLSRAYRMAVQTPPQQDPDNRLLSVYPLRRLDADALRDAMLCVSDELDRRRGGSSITKVTQYDYNYAHSTLRRSVYVPRFRNSVLDVFAEFDGPNPNMVTGRRGESQVPTQALLLMNSPWVRARAEAAARRVLEQPRAARLEHAFELVLSRGPLKSERGILDALQACDDLEEWTRTLHALLASIDFRYLQ